LDLEPSLLYLLIGLGIKLDKSRYKHRHWLH